MLNEFSDNVVDDFPNELPPKRDISHDIDFILGASLPNKKAYRLTPQGIEEVRKQVQGLVEKGLVQKILSPCAVSMRSTNNTYSKEGWRVEDVY